MKITQLASRDVSFTVFSCSTGSRPVPKMFQGTAAYGI
jgi:hypothetical protein